MFVSHWLGVHIWLSFSITAVILYTFGWIFSWVMMVEWSGWLNYAQVFVRRVVLVSVSSWANMNRVWMGVFCGLCGSRREGIVFKRTTNKHTHTKEHISLYMTVAICCVCSDYIRKKRLCCKQAEKGTNMKRCIWRWGVHVLMLLAVSDNSSTHFWYMCH